MRLTVLGVACVLVLGCGDDGRPGNRADGGEPTDAMRVDALAVDGDVADGGTGCVDPATLPMLGDPTLVLGGCSGPAPCGGTVDGLALEIAEACVPGLDLVPQVRAVCSAALLRGTTGESVSGNASFTDGTMSVSATVSARLQIDFPNACHGCRCADLETSLRSAGLDASCNPTCAGGTCFCDVGASIAPAVSESYTMMGTTLETSTGRTFDYCAEADGLTLRETGTAGPAVGRYRFASRPAVDFEICDGIDNDDNGTIDDDPRDCHPCRTAGVCEGTTEIVCAGTEGWTCTYTSTAFEMEETLCDGLDNDCDGEIDERPECREICDGVDNDENGLVDDSLDDTPPCSTAGVCTGVTARCYGASGWRCEGHPASYEPMEVSCDGIDNDCNGEVDEVCSSCADADKAIYVTAVGDQIGLWRMGINGEGSRRIVDAGMYDTSDPMVLLGRVYWQDRGIWSANLDGSDVQEVQAFYVGSPITAFAIDQGRGNLYWVEYGHVYRRNLGDAMSVREIWDGAGELLLDLERGRLYFTPDWDNPILYQTDLSGAGERTLTGMWTIGTRPRVLALDPVADRLYLGSSSSLDRAQLDATGIELVVRSPQYAGANGIAIDVGAGKVYWADRLRMAVSRANLDGTGAEDLVTGVQVTGVALSLCPAM